MSIFGRNTVEKVRVNRLWNRKQDRTTSGAPAQSGVSGPLPAHQHTGTGTGGSTLQPTNLRLIAATELTIASDAITVTQSHHRIDTQADAANDDLATVNGLVANTWYLLRPENDARTVVLKHGTGNIKCLGNADITLDDVQDGVLAFSPDGTTLYILTGAGGGIAGAHAILDGSTHSDSLAGSVVAGDLIRANSTPKWSRYGIGTQTQHLAVDAGFPIWTHDVEYTTAARDALVSPATGFSIRNSTLGAFQRNVGTSATPVWMSHGEDFFNFSLQAGRMITGSHRSGDRLYFRANEANDAEVGIQGPNIVAGSSGTPVFVIRTPSSSPLRPSFFGRNVFVFNVNDDQTGGNPNGYTNLELYALTPGTRSGWACFNTVGSETFPDIGTALSERVMYLSVHGRRETHQNHPAPGRSHISFYAPADSWENSTTTLSAGLAASPTDDTTTTMTVVNPAALIARRVYLVTTQAKTPGVTVPDTNDEYIYIAQDAPLINPITIKRGTWGTRIATHAGSAVPGVGDALWLVTRDPDAKFWEVTYGADSDPYSSPPSALRVFPRQADLDMGPQFLVFNRNSDWYEPFFARAAPAVIAAHATLDNVVGTWGSNLGWGLSPGLTQPTAFFLAGGPGSHPAVAALGLLYMNTTTRRFEMSGGIHLWPANPATDWLSDPTIMRLGATHNLNVGGGSTWVSFTINPTLVFKTNALFGASHFTSQPVVQNATGVTAFGPNYTVFSGPSYQSIVNATDVSVTHYGLYDAPAFSRTGTGTITASVVTVRSLGFAIPAGITVQSRRGLWVENWTNAGTFTLQVGVDIDALTGAATNFGIRNASNLVQTQYARFGGITAPTNIADGDVTMQRAFVLGSARFGGSTVPVATVDITGTLAATGDVSLTGGRTIHAGTADGADNSYIYLVGGGAFGSTRGAHVLVVGNEFGSGLDGLLQLSAGNVANGSILLQTTGVDRYKITNAGAMGWFAATPVVKQTVTGSRGGNAALASLLTAFANYGLVTDSSTA